MNVKSVYLIIVIGLMLPFSSFANYGVHPVTVSDCKRMMDSHAITVDNPVPCSRLSKVVFPYVDFSNKTREGEVVVFDAVAENTYQIFKEMFSKKLKINKALTMESYSGDDDASMADDNTSAFNGRAITGGNNWSKHAYGVAIDVNPLQNPYIGMDNGNPVIKPLTSITKYVNRNELRAGRPMRPGLAETMVDIFYKNGFLIWGGEWDSPIDYQHFEIGSRNFVEKLTKMPKQEAHQMFSRYVSDYRNCLKNSMKKNPALARNTCIVRVKQ